jgi:superfamily II DNA or RNA helicase
VSVSFEISSWNDFKNHLEAKSALEKGTAFEELTKLYLEYHPVYRTKLKTVWLQKEIPTTVSESLNLPSNDQGIDLVAETYEGTYWAIQCKYLQDENQTLSHRSISTFVSLSTGIAEKIAHCLVCTTVDDYAKIYKGRKNIGFINADEWRKLDQTFFDWCRARAKGQSLKLAPSKPRPHQQKALDSAQVYFGQEGNHRGKLIFPCGAGKSLTGFWMLQQLKARSTLIAVPSLALVKQTLDVYLREIVALDRKVKWLCVCSDEGIGKDDDVVFYTENLGVPCLTDPAYIQNWLIQNKNEEIILFTTYQSGRIVGEACQKMNFTFDLGIYDEAHKTVGAEKKLFSYLLFDENIRVQKRIFMTATERFYRGSKDDIISMDDEDIYGETFAHMSFKEAIDLGLLTDYKVITIEVSKAEIADFIKKNHLVQTNEKWNKDTEARSLASMLALRKAMERYPIRNAVSFHSSIDKAQRSKDLQGHISTTYHYEPVDAFTVSGKVPTSKRNRIIQEFAQSPKAVITNARCLTEGVDVPNIDCIVYADPRKSKVDIIQALGRALRKKEGKEWGYVVLPVIYNAESHEIDNENFQEILSVVRGLASNDERIVDYFKDQADPTKATKKSDQQFQLQVLTEFMDEMELSSQLHIRLWDHLSRFSWMPFEEARDSVRELNITTQKEFRGARKRKILPFNLPSHPHVIYLTKGWSTWADFFGSDNHVNKQYLPFEQAKNTIHKFGLKNNQEWREFCKSDKLPRNIPKTPEKVYHKTWQGFGDWLGTNNIAPHQRDFMTYLEAKKFVSKFKLKTQREYRIFCQSPNRPPDLPTNPNSTYKNSGWISFGEFLGTGKIAPQLLKFIDFKQAKISVRQLGLKNQKEWFKFCKSGKKDEAIPSNPQNIYKNQGWNGWGDFLGTNKTSTHVIEFLSYEESKNKLRALNLKNAAEWRIYSKTNRPNKIPSNPNTYYKNKGWKGWPDFLGYG